MSAEETLFDSTLDDTGSIALAESVAEVLKPGDCVALYGDLGAGKSTFVRGAIQALCDAREVPSPTFTLVQSYDGLLGPIWHFDAYRLKKEDEVFELGWEDALAGIVFVEWPTRIEALLPKRRLAIRFDFDQDSEQRRISIQGDSTWALRLSPVLPPLLRT